MSSTVATTFSGYSAGSDTASKILPNPMVTSTSGNSALYQSNKVGGRRIRRKNTKRYRKTTRRSARNRTTKQHRRTQKNRQ